MLITKKLAMLVAALSLNTYALFCQDYCDISFANDDFKIRDVQFATSEFFGWFHKIPYVGVNNYCNYYDNASFRMYVEPGETYDLDVKTMRSNYLSGQVVVHADWDGDGTFEWSEDFGFNEDINYDHNGSFTVPANATPGATRLRIVFELSTGILPAADACGTKVNGCAVDYQVIVRDNTPMTYEGFEIKTIENPIFLDMRREEFLIGINVKTKGGQDNLRLSQITADWSASSDFYSDARVLRAQYSKGHNSAFSYTLNATYAIASGSAIWPFDDIYQDYLLPGDNWFWFMVDLLPNPQVGNTISCAITEMVIDDNGTLTTIPINSVTSSREISDKQYCFDDVWHGRGRYHIDSVRIGNLSFSNFEPQTKSSFNYQNRFTTYVEELIMCSANSYDLELKYNYYSLIPSAMFIHAYFDWNQDGDFDEPNEHYLLNNDISTPVIGYNWARAKIEPPKNAKAGHSIMRIATSGNMTPFPCEDIGETQDFGYVLHTPGYIEIDQASSVLLNPEQIELSAVNPVTNYNYQYSYDGINWSDYAGSNNQSVFTTPIIDTTAQFRLKTTNANCPNNTNYSSSTILPYLGLGAFKDISYLCENDTTELVAEYDYRPAHFENENPNADGTDLIPVEASINVDGINEQKLNHAVIDSVCVNLTYTASTSIYLYAPNTDTEVKIRLTDRLNYADPDNPGDVIAKGGRYCFVPEQRAVSVIEEDSEPGVYAPLESFERLFNIDPNGTWTLMIYGENANSGEVLESFELHFGNEQSLVWRPNNSISSIDKDTVKVFPKQKMVYTAELTNNYGVSKDSTRIIPVSGQPIDLKIDPINQSELCEGYTISVVAPVSETVFHNLMIWEKNGAIVQGQSGSVYSSNIFNTNDKIKVSLNVASSCRTYDEEDSVVLAINPVLSPEASLIPNLQFPLCEDEDQLTFFADTANFGSKPANIKWYLNNQIVQANGITMTLNSINDEDVVKLEVSGNVSCLVEPTVERLMEIEYADTLTTDFSTSSEGLTRLFNPADLSYTQYYWDFGDGQFSNEMQPEHEYDTLGAYKVCLTVTDENDCSKQGCETISVVNTSVQSYKNTMGISVGPNPTNNHLYVNGLTSATECFIYDELGKLVYAKEVNSSDKLNLSFLPNGVYSVRLKNSEQHYTQRIVKQ